MIRKTAILLIFLSVCGLVSHAMGGALPTLRWFFESGETFGTLTLGSWELKWADVIGYLCMGAALVIGVVLLISGKKDIEWKPMTLRKFQRFKSLRRGYVAFVILVVLIILAMLDQALVGKRPLILKYEGSFYFPAFSQKQYTGNTFDQPIEGETNYRELKKTWKASNSENWMMMPVIPWDPVLDSQDLVKVQLEKRDDGLYYLGKSGKPYSGIAYTHYQEKPDQVHSQVKFRKGKQSRRTEGFLIDGQKVVVQEWDKGEKKSEKIYDDLDLTPWTEAAVTPLEKTLYPALAPDWGNAHYLGTDSQGWDIIATLYGGFQVVLKAAFLYLGATYVIGLTIGCLMGYFGGKFDIITQRFVEILANIPFLFVVMIINNRLEPEHRTIAVIVGIMCLFSWIGLTYYMRTATYREKARDYVAASRLLGASAPRIIFSHILPNAISTIVTLIPFSFAGVATALTALDFIGFGLPEHYPSWGRTLSDGVANLDSPWIVLSVFGCMVTVLLLITFIGEAVREAFDPKKFTFYK